MNIRYNINKIHSDLIFTFEDVQINEKSDKEFGNYFEIKATKYNGSDLNSTLRMVIKKSEIQNETFNWSYYANPLNEDSDLVERKSNIGDIHNHIQDIVINNRFNKEYLSSIKNEN